MKKKSKKKRNPSLLSWIVDPLKGFYSPLINKALELTAKDIVKVAAFSPRDVINVGLEGAEIVRDAILMPPVPVSPEAAKTDMFTKSGDVEKAAAVILGATAIASAVPMVHVGEAIDEIWRLPSINALMRIAVDTYTAGFDYGIKPSIQRFMFKKYTPLVPEPYRLAEMTSKGIVEWKRYIDAMAESGLSGTWAADWASAQMMYPDLGVSLSLLRRGEIDDGTFKKFMYRSQYGADETDAMLELKDVIPPLPDLITMAVREAFGTHTYEEQMPALKTWGNKMGLTSEWVENYWYAHWERIPLREMYSNLWREYWTEDDFTRMLRIKDVHPDDRKAILDVAYLPPSIREMGYGYDMGVYTRDDIVRYRKWGGMSPPDAEKAADSLILYRTSAEIEAVRREYLWMRAHGKISKDFFKSLLEFMETPKETIEWWLIRGDLQLERFKKPEFETEGRIVSSAEAKWAFKNKIRGETWLRTTLAELDWTSERIDLTVERLKFEMLPPVEPEEVVKERLLTVSQLEKLYGLREVDREYVYSKLLALTYTEETATLILKLMEYAPPIELKVRPLTTSAANGLYDLEVFNEHDLFNAYTEMGYDEVHSWFNVMYTRLRLEYPYLRAMYEKGLITIETLINDLQSLGLTSEQASHLGYKTRRELQIERLTKERALTKSEIMKGVKNKILTPFEGVRLMTDLGYDEWEAHYIFELNKIVVAGDPQGYWEMRKVTEAYKRARGEPAIEIPETVLTLESAIREQSQRIEELRRENAEEEDINTALLALSRLEQQMVELIKELKLA